MTTSGHESQLGMGALRVYTAKEVRGIDPSLLVVPLGKPVKLNSDRRMQKDRLDMDMIRNTVVRKLSRNDRFFTAIPVILRNTGDRGSSLVVLGLGHADQTPVTYSADYYTAFESSIATQNLSDNLERYENSPEMQDVVNRFTGTDAQAKAIILGNSYTGNYAAVVDQHKRLGLQSELTVIDVNPIPVGNLQTSGLLRQHDRVVQGDIAAMPFDDNEKFDIAYADLVTNCSPNSTLKPLFTSVKNRLADGGVLFLSVLTNNYFGGHQIEELENIELLGRSFVQPEIYLPSVTFFKKTLAAVGLKSRVIEVQATPETNFMKKCFLAITHE